MDHYEQIVTLNATTPNDLYDVKVAHSEYLEDRSPENLRNLMDARIEFLRIAANRCEDIKKHIQENDRSLASFLRI